MKEKKKNYNQKKLLKMVLQSIIMEVTPEEAEARQAAFFGFIGIACALVFASKLIRD